LISAADKSFQSDHLDPNDLETFNRFNPPQFDDPILHPGESGSPKNSQTTNLADLILEKIALHEAATASAAKFDQEDKAVELAPKVIETYTLIGTLLSRYKSGPLPKAFKILPTLPMPTLLAVLPYTNPSKWTPHAIFAATKLFISNKSPIAQSFLTNILLDRVREDIADTRKLNVHLYNALRKALFRPPAFFRGLLFPLLSSGTCTLREAHIISSVLVRSSVPAIHSAVALAKLCEIAADQMHGNPESAGSTNLFIRVLLEKRYALPYQTVDALVFHFLRFKPSVTSVGEMDVDDRESYEGKLPVIWHQGLLAFARTYKDSITEDQREALLDLLLVRGHKEIAPEVRRELLAGRGRGVVVEQYEVGDGGDDTMMGG
jgi:essential nuclear protein 1